MLLTPHLLAGACLGRYLRRPAWLVPAALASHHLLDAIPHLDAHQFFGGAGGIRPLELGAGVLDLVVGGLLVGWLGRKQPRAAAVYLGALLAILIDLADHIPPWGDWFSGWPLTAPLSAFHHAWQINVSPGEWPLGFGTQILISGICIWLLQRGSSSRGGVEKSPGDGIPAAPRERSGR